MKKDKDYTDQEIDDFLNRADFDLLIEVWEENMTEEDIPFADFLKRYQPKHRAKYGKELPLKLT